MENTNLVTIIIPARNSGKTIEKCLDSICKLTYDNFEVILIDDGSTDNTAEKVRKFSDVKLIKTGGKGPGYARNIACREAKGEFIAFTDADCIVDKNWLSELKKCFTSADIIGAGGIQNNPEDSPVFSGIVAEYLSIIGFTADYLKNDREIISTRHNPTCNVMYRKSFLNQLGGFREDLWPGEDIELDFYRLQKYKLKYKLLYNPKAIVYHYRADSYDAFIRMMLRYGNALSCILKLYGIKRFYDALPFIFLFILILIITGLIIKPVSTIIFISSGLLFWILFFLIKSPKNFKTLFILFVLNIIFWSLGFWQGIFTVRKKNI